METKLTFDSCPNPNTQQTDIFVKVQVLKMG